MNWTSEGLNVGDVVWTGGKGALEPLRVVRITKSAVFVRHVGCDRYNLKNGRPYSDNSYSWRKHELNLRRDCPNVREHFRMQVERDMVERLQRSIKPNATTFTLLIEELDRIRIEAIAKITCFAMNNTMESYIMKIFDEQEREWQANKAAMEAAQ